MQRKCWYTYRVQKKAITMPSAALRYSFLIFTGSTCRTSRELSIRFTVCTSIITAFLLLTIITPSPRTAISHFVISGLPVAPPRQAQSHVWSALSLFRSAVLAGTRASPAGLPASGTSARPAVRLNLLWQGNGKENARGPPSLDSPLSAAPETFLLRDAVSAFPIASVRLPQPLPGARYP